jgi:hypothetical protein
LFFVVRSPLGLHAAPSSVTGIVLHYAELGSVALLRAELDRLGLVSKRREGTGGRLTGGQHFSRGALYLMLQNRIYRGEITHQGTAYPGQHKAILDPRRHYDRDRGRWVTDVGSVPTHSVD